MPRPAGAVRPFPAILEMRYCRKHGHGLDSYFHISMRHLNLDQEARRCRRFPIGVPIPPSMQLYTHPYEGSPRTRRMKGSVESIMGVGLGFTELVFLPAPSWAPESLGRAIKAMGHVWHVGGVPTQEFRPSTTRAGIGLWAREGNCFVISTRKCRDYWFFDRWWTESNDFDQEVQQRRRCKDSGARMDRRDHLDRPAAKDRRDHSEVGHRDRRGRSGQPGQQDWDQDQVRLDPSGRGQWG